MKEQERKKEWEFIHTIVKQMVLNTMQCAQRLFRPNKDVLVKKLEDLNFLDLKIKYASIMRALGELYPNHKILVKRGYTGTVNIIFTIFNDDWIYRKLIGRYHQLHDELKRKSKFEGLHDFRSEYNELLGKIEKIEKYNEEERNNIYDRKKEIDDTIRETLMEGYEEPEINTR